LVRRGGGRLHRPWPAFPAIPIRPVASLPWPHLLPERCPMPSCQPTSHICRYGSHLADPAGRPMCAGCNQELARRSRQNKKQWARAASNVGLLLLLRSTSVLSSLAGSTRLGDSWAIDGRRFDDGWATAERRFGASAGLDHSGRRLQAPLRATPTAGRDGWGHNRATAGRDGWSIAFSLPPPLLNLSHSSPTPLPVLSPSGPDPAPGPTCSPSRSRSCPRCLSRLSAPPPPSFPRSHSLSRG